MANRMVEDIAIRKNLVGLPFQFTNVPDSTGTLATLQATTTDYVMPKRGSVVGISVSSNAAFDTGTVTFRPTVSGTAKTALSTALSASAQRNYAEKPADVVPFAAGAYLGMDFVKSGTVAPTTNDISGILWVLLEDWDF